MARPLPLRWSLRGRPSSVATVPPVVKSSLNCERSNRGEAPLLNQPEKKPRRRVKKLKGHAAHHGGAWKVAYADFVTAMMALFMVLWLLTQADMKLRQQIAQYFRDQGVLSG